MRTTDDARVACAVTGFAVGGLADGIVLHQILQWHHLWSARTPAATVDGLEANTLADGLFHAACLALLVAGIAMLASRRVAPGSLIAFGLVGWGYFHVVDQLVFHVALGAHHVRDDAASHAAYDWGFFAAGVAMIAVGLAAARRRARV
ncbi:MAG TPA: DUF2243 domain-containing protein [Actinomycetota bacterium]|nr:DUF2243 domain-containing protein [Actinomycetota bacterium]